MMQAWSASPPARAQSYSVACVEGHRLRGHRTEGYQALRCPTCGEGIFVLPRSPLPEPPTPASAPRPREAVAPDFPPDDDPLPLTDPPPSGMAAEGVQAEAEAEIDWVDDVAEAPRPSTPAEVAPPKVKGPGPDPGAKPRPRPRPATAPARTEPAAPAVRIAARTSPAEWAWRHRNPLLAAGVVLLVIGAIAIRQRRQRLDELPRIAEIGRTEGLKKLDAGDFQPAKKLLAEASAAVDGLGGRFEGADSIRQGAREAAIFTDLAADGLKEIVEEAATFRDVNNWSSYFATHYRGRSIILDAPITDVPDPARPGSRYEIAYPIFVGRGPRPDARGRVDLAGLELFDLSSPQVGEQKPFGVRLKAMELDVASGDWVFTVEPDSGVFITHTRALEANNWPPSEPAEEPRP